LSALPTRPSLTSLSDSVATRKSLYGNHDLQVCIGSDTGNHITIRVVGALNCSEEYGFFSAEIDIQAGFWRGAYPATFQLGDFQRLRKQLQVMYDWQDNTAEFTTMEGWLALKLTLDHLGHVRLEGIATDYPGTGNTLTFHIDIDQSYLPRIIADLASMERALTES
jgi:hypothetical protein